MPVGYRHTSSYQSLTVSFFTPMKKTTTDRLGTLITEEPLMLRFYILLICTRLKVAVNLEKIFLKNIGL